MTASDVKFTAVIPVIPVTNAPLETKPWGLRQFSVVDLDGNRITFAQPA